MVSVGFDIGGTFTDVFVVDEMSDETYREKVPTTPEDYAHGQFWGSGLSARRAILTWRT